MGGVRIWRVILLAGVTATVSGFGQDVLRFRNGNQLTGRWLDATAATGLRWQTPGAAQPILFDFVNLHELQLAPRPPSCSRGLHPTIVELTNGDQLTGEVVGLTERVLTLETWYAGRLALQRAMVRRVVWRDALPDVIYAGPTGLADWKVGNQPNTWTYRQGKFYSQPGRYGSIGRDVGLPDVARIDFEVAWRGQPQWNVGFYCVDPVNINAGGYNLNYSGNYISMNRADQGRSRNLESGQSLSGRPARPTVRVSLRVHKLRKTIAVFFDEVLVKQWTDPQAFAGAGRCLIFTTQGQCQLRIGNLRVRHWDGRLDEAAPAGSETEDILLLANHDKVSGQIRTMAGGEVALLTPYADVKVPVARLAGIQFANGTRATARRESADVRGFLPDSTRITLALEKVDATTLTGASENFSRITLPLDALTRVQFRVHEKPPESEEDWGAAAPEQE
jgi:hypothetical protein